MTASIHCNAKRIGWVQMPADGGRTLLTFDAENERDGFERFIDAWWDEARSRVTMDLLAVEIAAKDPFFVPSRSAKLKYWICMVAAQAADRKLPSAA
ncbi:hypothetical protein [Noviherbaspirillum galbum]|uniref:Uncharacterized protein n=1 Tax=Noviherbaspirillum galbum TaxID=2709383 RepID=A0A6B3SRT4_9BURK|nr:hypothetical protein [Noviherbaspirillum galbum]NEX63463.1 hypothetical protein [Noviherbaspirillum galbum]